MVLRHFVCVCEIPHTYVRTHREPQRVLVSSLWVLRVPLLSGLNRTGLWIYESYYEGSEKSEKRKIDFIWSNAATNHVHCPQSTNEKKWSLEEMFKLGWCPLLS